MDRLLKVLQIIPSLIGVIKAIEELMPVDGQGAAKLQMVRDIMTKAYDSIDDIWPTLEAVIEKIVYTFNKLGIFKKQEPADNIDTIGS